MTDMPILCGLLDILGFMMDIFFSIFASTQQTPLSLFGSPSDILGIFSTLLGCSTGTAA